VNRRCRCRQLRRACRPLIFEAFALVALLRCALSCASYAKVRHALDRWRLLRRPSAIVQVHQSADEIASAVIAVSRCLPWLTTCLVDALAVELMLRRRGFEPVLRFGIRGRAPDRPLLEAHAWVECAGSIVVGDLAEFSEYSAFTSHS
jgi:hypothetical protein